VPDITPQFVMQYERRMAAITENEYVRRLAAQNTWWNKIMRPTPIEGKTQRLTWFLDTALIEPVGPSGTGAIDLEGMVAQSVELPTFRHGKGIEVQRDQLEDLDGTGLNALAKWSENIGNETAYYPQRLGAQLLLNGANTDGSANAYDGVPFFADASNPHPVNPFDLSKGYYANWCHGSSSNALVKGYPGALPIHSYGSGNVTADVAYQNYAQALACIQSVRMPNGVDPRFLTPRYICGPQALAPRLSMLTDAKFIAAAAASGGGSLDVSGFIQRYGLGEPLIIQEISAATSYSSAMPFVNTGGVSTWLNETMTGSDTTWYIVCQEMQTTQLGGLLLVQRKPFKVNYYTGDSGGTAMSMELDRMNKFEYHVQGRMAPAYGHPYTIFRFDAS